MYQKTTRNSYLESKDGPGRPASNMDRFERCLSIFKLTKDRCVGQKQGTKQSATLTESHVTTVCSFGDPTQAKGEGNGESLTGSCQKTEPNPQSHPHPLSQIHPSNLALNVLGQEKSLDVDQAQTSGHKPWRAVRVDLVVSPVSQFAFALLGWTGSKVAF